MTSRSSVILKNLFLRSTPNAYTFLVYTYNRKFQIIVPPLSFCSQRIIAPPGHTDRSRLSVMVQHLCHIHWGFVIKGKVFVPPPRVSYVKHYGYLSTYMCMYINTLILQMSLHPCVCAYVFRGHECDSVPRSFSEC